MKFGASTKILASNKFGASTKFNAEFSLSHLAVRNKLLVEGAKLALSFFALFKSGMRPAGSICLVHRQPSITNSSLKLRINLKTYEELSSVSQDVRTH